MLSWTIFLIGFVIACLIHAVIRCLEKIIYLLEKFEKQREKKTKRKQINLKYPARANYLNN